MSVKLSYRNIALQCFNASLTVMSSEQYTFSKLLTSKHYVTKFKVISVKVSFEMKQTTVKVSPMKVIKQRIIHIPEHLCIYIRKQNIYVFTSEK